MKIVEYVAAYHEKREPARADFNTIEQMLSLPWVAKHRVNRGFVRFSIANGDTLVTELSGKPSLRVIGRITECDAEVLSELPAWNG